MRRYTIILAVRPHPDPNGILPGYEFLMVGNRKRGGRYELPGGTVEPGEDALDGARREFLEETGHHWENPRLVQRRSGAFGEGYVYLSGVGPRLQEPEAIVSDVRFFARLPPREQLSFPDDPYEDLFAVARQRLAKPPARPERP